MRRRLVLTVLLVSLASSLASCGDGDDAPLEDVTLRGRILRPDNEPFANRKISVESVRPRTFSNDETKRYDATTDAQGRYEFTFPKAKRQGKQTNTDYYLRASLGPLRASYELELSAVVHQAPDLTFWEPTLSLAPSGNDYRVTMTEFVGGHTFVSALAGRTELGQYKYGTIDGREIQDVALTLVPNAFADVGADGTIYHQRFSGERVAFRGSHVPLSRRLPCTATREDGTARECSGLTNGDLVAPVLPKDCCTAVTIDLGKVRSIDEIDADDCTCSIDVSVDGTTWVDFRYGTPPKSPGRYVRVTSKFLEQIEEISVWG